MEVIDLAGEGIPYRADTGGGVGATPDLRAPLGAPPILRPEDFTAMANFNDPTVALKNAADLTSSLIDNHYNNQIKWMQARADLDKTVADTGLLGAQTENIQSDSEQRKQLMPLKIQEGNQLVQRNKYTLDNAKRDADQNDKAYDEFGSWRDEISKLDPNSPDYDDKLYAINQKYPNASTNPNTMTLIKPVIDQQTGLRQHSTRYAQSLDQISEATVLQKSGLIPPDVDIRARVNAGDGQSLINGAKRQYTIQRLQIAEQSTPVIANQHWIQTLINDIKNPASEEGGTFTFTPTGDLNPGSEARLSSIERSAGLSPQYPGAKKKTEVKTKDATTGTETTVTTEGIPVTSADVGTGPRGYSADQATIATQIQQDPVYQQVKADAASGKNPLPQEIGGDAQATNAEYMKRYTAAKAALGQPLPSTTPQTQQPAQPGAVPPPQQPAPAKKTVPPNRMGIPLSEAEPVTIPSGENRSFATLQPDFAGKAQAFTDGMRERGYEVVPIQTGRSPDYQAELHQKYLAGGPLAASPGHSFHEYGRAFDYAIRTPDGKLHMDDQLAQQAYKVGQQIAPQYGLHGLGDQDNDHLEDADYTLKTLPKEQYGVIRARAQGAVAGGTQVAAAETQPAVLNLQSDPIYQQLYAEAKSGANPLPGGLSPDSQEGQASLMERYQREQMNQPIRPALATQQPMVPVSASTTSTTLPTIPPEYANRTQVQSAPAPMLVSNDPKMVDWHTFKFGPTTTFGLNQDGSIDRADDGQGFYTNPSTGRPYNTRDPRLIGASVPKADLVAAFGPEAARPNSNISQAIARGDFQVQVVDPNGAVMQVPLVDAGPSPETHNRIDLTHAAARIFRTGGKAVLGYRFVNRSGEPLQVTQVAA